LDFFVAKFATRQAGKNLCPNGIFGLRAFLDGVHVLFDIAFMLCAGYFYAFPVIKDESKDIDLYWNEKTKSLAVKENEEWKQNKMHQERLRLMREQQERLRPKRGQEPPLGEQRKSRGMHR
jgi:hypothetical protein